MSKNVHVVHSQGEWKVRREGSMRASKVFETKKEAIGYGCRLGKNERLELYIHNKDGRISDRRSYGKDPFPTRG
ncbi:DUF2188 domain-containing protein [Prevotella sp. lc2012]|uniref:DUF2188 domain-containing protein n=1 Tax=Prevotella sp. lc2012 TaxID=1761886 RepID=UPI00089AF537|nr:hypothetical protein SAMN04487828_0412 [Prevotella sp. lc2012]